MFINTLQLFACVLRFLSDIVRWQGDNFLYKFAIFWKLFWYFKEQLSRILRVQSVQALQLQRAPPHQRPISSNDNDNNNYNDNKIHILRGDLHHPKWFLGVYTTPSTSQVGMFLSSFPLLSNFYHVVNQSYRVTLDSAYFVNI